MSSQARRPAGTPVGGQFAATQHRSSDVGLWTEDLTNTHARLSRLAGDLEVNGGDRSALEAELAPLGADVASAAVANLAYAHQAFAELDAQYSDWTEDHPEDEAVQAVDYADYADEDDPDFAGYHEAVSGEYRTAYDGLIVDAARALAGEADHFDTSPFGASQPAVTYFRSIQTPMAA